MISTASVAPISPAVNTSYDNLIGASAVRKGYGVDGSGMAAAIIDTGADYHHPALGGGFGPGYKVEGGYDLAMKDGDPLAETWSHGTMVAGLIASEAPDASGVAPGADVVPLRVFGNDNQGSFNLIADALQYVVDNHERLHISVVNISLSDGGNYTSDPFGNSAVGTRLRGLIQTLRDLKIPVVAASGNSFNGSAQGMGYLAIIGGTISVTASDGRDHLVGNAQRLGQSLGGGSATDLAAPGADLLTTSENGGFARVTGTSFAAPLVSGAILLLQEIYQARFGTLPAVADVERWLTQGSTPIHDSASGITVGRLDIGRAAALIPPAPKISPPPKEVDVISAPGSKSGQAPTPPSNPTPAPPTTQPTTKDEGTAPSNQPSGPATPSDPPSRPESEPTGAPPASGPNVPDSGTIPQETSSGAIQAPEIPVSTSTPVRSGSGEVPVETNQATPPVLPATSATNGAVAEPVMTQIDPRVWRLTILGLRREAWSRGRIADIRGLNRLLGKQSIAPGRSRPGESSAGLDAVAAFRERQRLWVMARRAGRG